jgi:hypothetical protein
MRVLAVILTTMVAMTVALRAEPRSNNVLLEVRQDCCEDPPGCGCPDFCSGVSDRIARTQKLRDSDEGLTIMLNDNIGMQWLLPLKETI